jgi:hypothetical protein
LSFSKQQFETLFFPLLQDARRSFVAIIFIVILSVCFHLVSFLLLRLFFSMITMLLHTLFFISLLSLLSHLLILLCFFRCRIFLFLYSALVVIVDHIQDVAVVRMTWVLQDSGLLCSELRH